MAENIFTSFDISGEGLSVQRKRLSSIAKNIANVNTTKGPDGKPYQREVVTGKSVENKKFDRELKSQVTLSMTGNDGYNGAKTNIKGTYGTDPRYVTADIQSDSAAPRMVYDPAHPDANEKGYVSMPNINIVTEMVEMIVASRSFEANSQVIESAKNVARDSLDI